MIRRSSSLVLLYLWCVAVLLTCSSAPPPLAPAHAVVSDDPAVEAEFRKARALFEDGKLDEADRAMETLAADHPKDPLARSAVVYRARIALAQNDPSRARGLLAPLLEGSDPVAERAAFYDGVALHRLGKHLEAREKLSRFFGRLTDPEENLLLVDTLWKATQASGDIAGAVKWLDRYLDQAQTDANRNAALGTLARLIRQIKDVEELDDLLEELDPKGTAWSMVVAHMAELHLEKGRLDAASQTLDRAEKEGVADSPTLNRLAETIEEWSEVRPDVIGCLVPLTGRSRLVGDAVVKGLMLGVRLHAERTGGEPLTVLIRDSKSSPDDAVAALEDLVQRDHVLAVVGPLDAVTTGAVAERADGLRVPMIAMTVDDTIPNDKPYVFRNFPSNSSEIDVLVDTALGLGNERFAVLAPENGYGKTMTALLSARLEKKGAPEAVVVTSPEDATKFTDEAESLAEVDFDVLLVPDTANRLALIAPALAAAGLWARFSGEPPPGSGRGFQLLAPSAAYSKDLPRRAGRYLSGAILSSYFAPEAAPRAGRFVERFYEEYRANPTYLSAFAHDIAVLLTSARAEGVQSRVLLRKYLDDVEAGIVDIESMAAPFDGFTLEGNPEAKPWLLQISGNELVPLP